MYKLRPSGSHLKWFSGKVKGIVCFSHSKPNKWLVAGRVTQEVEYLPSKCKGPEFKPQYH
jgi:hypothetical protein